MHLHSLISVLVIRLLESIISRLASKLNATSKISIFKQVSVAKQAGWNLALSETPKTGFLRGVHLLHFHIFRELIS